MSANFAEIDFELQRRQDKILSLQAENKSLRKALADLLAMPIRVASMADRRAKATPLCDLIGGDDTIPKALALLELSPTNWQPYEPRGRE